MNSHHFRHLTRGNNILPFHPTAGVRQAARQNFLLIIAAIAILATPTLLPLSLPTVPAVDAFSSGAGHCETGSLTGKFSGHGEGGGGPLTNGSLQVKFSGSNSALQPTPFGWPKLINPNQAYTVTIEFSYVNPNFLFRGFLVRLSDRNGNALDSGTMYVGSNTSTGVQAKWGCDANVSALTHTSSSTKQRITFDFEYTDSSYAELLLEVTVVRERAANNWFYSSFYVQVGTPATPAPVASTPAPVASTPAPVASTPAPVASTPAPVASTPAPVASTPAPVASTPAPVASTPAPVASTPAPVASTPAPVADTCVDTTGRWRVNGTGNRRNWCALARNEDDTDTYCSDNNLYDGCPVTCNSCPSTTPAPVPFTTAPAGSSTCTCTDEIDALQSEIDMLKTTLQEVMNNLQTSAPTATATSAPTICKDRDEQWKINGLGRKKNWCIWASEQANTIAKCELRGIEGDCPVTCELCTP